MLPQHGDGLGGCFLGRIKKGEVTGQNQIALVGFGIGGAFVHFLSRNGQHAKTVLAQFIDLLDEIAGQDWLHRKYLALALEVRAPCKDRFRRAFG